MGEFVPLCKQHWLLSKLVQGHVPMLSRILRGRRAYGNEKWHLHLPSPHEGGMLTSDIITDTITDTISDADGGTRRQ